MVRIRDAWEQSSIAMIIYVQLLKYRLCPDDIQGVVSSWKRSQDPQRDGSRLAPQSVGEYGQSS
jgi:hypothetical protein